MSLVQMLVKKKAEENSVSTETVQQTPLKSTRNTEPSLIYTHWYFLLILNKPQISRKNDKAIKTLKIMAKAQLLIWKTTEG